MKRNVLYLIILMLVVMSTTTVAAAGGIQPETFSVSGLVGGYSFDGKQHLDTSLLMGLRGGYNFTENLGVEALFDYVRTEGTLSDERSDVYRYGGDALWHFFPKNNLVPYLAAGYSAITHDRSINKTSTKGIFDYGVGVKYFLTDELAMRADFRHLAFRDNETLYNYEYTVGLNYQFGGKKPVVTEAPAPVPAPVPKAAPVVVEEPPLEPPPATEPTPERFKYCTTLHIEFDIDKTEIRPEFRDEVAKVGNFMKQYPTTTAVIEGHTDNVGTAEHNMDLSQRRAESVISYLAENFGIERSRLVAKGYGLTRPVADNSTNEGKQKNRRIEAIIDCAFDVKEITPPERLCMLLQVEFDSGKADIKPQHHAEIAKLGDFMTKYPTTTAVVEGHTDNVGGQELNMKLSQQRAENVVTYLVEKFGIDRSRLSAKGFAYTRRLAYNTTPEGRQKNRRITAVVDCVIKP